MTGRFGLLTMQPAQPEPYEAVAERWRRAEAMGFDSIWVADGLETLRGALAYEPWALLGALARETRRARIGTLISSLRLRHPALLAKAALTIDHLSAGRLELGVGIGDPLDRRVLGLKPWSAEERAGRLDESVRILDALLRGEDVSFAGRYYRARLRLDPPIQRPRPPILIAANARATIAIAARHADAWNTLGGQPEGDAEPIPLEDAIERTRRQIETLDEACRSAGRDPRSVRRTVLAFRVRPPVFASADRFREFIGRYGELGIDDFYLPWPVPGPRQAEQEAAMERVASDVIPRLRGGLA